ncbi:hypothetical protein [Ruthenibacterium lactatiformans]|uniref:hypothetical protein n=1 Tax=Ruthenibacterium lactatiformans TaxID=1550024 RepID=UPI0030807E9C
MRVQVPLQKRQKIFFVAIRQPLKPLVSLFFGEQAAFLLRVQKTGLAFRLLFFVCHFAKWPKPSPIIFKYKKLFSYKTIFHAV